MTDITSEDVNRLAGEVVGLRLLKVQVRLAEVDFKSEPPEFGLVVDDVGASLGVAVKWLTTANQEHGRILMSVRYTLRALSADDAETVPADASADEGDEGPSAWEAAVEFQAQWILEDPGALTDNHLRAFAVRVGLMTIHPYARAQIQSLVAEAGWGIFTMDVLTNVDAIFVGEREGMLDLEGIAVER